MAWRRTRVASESTRSEHPLGLRHTEVARARRRARSGCGCAAAAGRCPRPPVRTTPPTAAATAAPRSVPSGWSTGTAPHTTRPPRSRKSLSAPAQPTRSGSTGAEMTETPEAMIVSQSVRPGTCTPISRSPARGVSVERVDEGGQELQHLGGSQRERRVRPHRPGPARRRRRTPHRRPWRLARRRASAGRAGRDDRTSPSPSPASVGHAGGAQPERQRHRAEHADPHTDRRSAVRSRVDEPVEHRRTSRRRASDRRRGPAIDAARDRPAGAPAERTSTPRDALHGLGEQGAVGAPPGVGDDGNSGWARSAMRTASPGVGARQRADRGRQTERQILDPTHGVVASGRLRRRASLWGCTPPR